MIASRSSNALTYMGKEFDTTPQTVPHVSTKYRTICTQVPHPESLQPQAGE